MVVFIIHYQSPQLDDEAFGYLKRVIVRDAPAVVETDGQTISSMSTLTASGQTPTDV